jgi:hypothetical protein
VPLGFSRVYVHLDEPFTFDAWMRGLAASRSFVTTGPMLIAKAEGQWPGSTFQVANAKDYRLNCAVQSEQPLESIELVVNGVVTERFNPQNKKMVAGAFATEISTIFKPKQRRGWLGAALKKDPMAVFALRTRRRATLKFRAGRFGRGAWKSIGSLAG